MNRSSPVSRRLEEFLAKGGVHTASSMEEAGFNRAFLARAVESGKLVQYARGIYCSVDSLGEEGISLAALTLLNPDAVVCLYSAAQVHRLADDDPPQTWMALDRSVTTHPLREASNLPARTVWWQPTYFSDGIETRRMAGVDVRITDLPRTVVDLVRMRRRVGDETAMKALHDYVRMGAPTADLWDRAKAIDALDVVEPFYRAADEFKESMPSGRM